MSAAHKKTGAEDVHWDLSPLYSGPEDPKIDEDLKTWEAKAKAFAKSHEGRLTKDLTKVIADYADLSMLQSKIQGYLSLALSVDTGNAALKAKSAEADKVIAAVMADHLAFFELEMSKSREDTVTRLAAKDPLVAKHLPWIQVMQASKPHYLKQEVEAALIKRSPFSEVAWHDFFAELESDLRFKIDGKPLTLEEALNILEVSRDADKRAKALKTINEGLGGTFAKYAAETLYLTMASKEVDDGERGYRHPMQQRNLMSGVPDALIEGLHEAVMHRAVPLAKRYYRLKAAHLGRKTLRWSDRNAPMPFTDTSIIPWEQAVKTVLGAYESFSPTLAGFARQAIEEKRVHAAALPSKQSGAYNHALCLPTGPVSYTFMTYQGSLLDVETLGHELGHCGQYMLIGKDKGELMLDVPKTYAETPSGFGELLVFERLKAEMTGRGAARRRLSLIMRRLDGMMNTVVRQIGFSNFERSLHGHDRWELSRVPTRKRSADELDQLWLKSLYEMYGEPGEVFTFDNSEHLWSYVHHFHDPFYTHCYTFGEFWVHSLRAAWKRLGEKFEPLYLEFLRASSSKGALELAKPLDLDLTWHESIKVGMESLIEEAEALSRSMGVRSPR